MIRIIAGRYKNLLISKEKKANYRPTTTRLKEAIFSILTSGEFLLKGCLEDSTVLDLFSGSGSLGFEALSRGAKFVSFIDIDRNNLESSKKFATSIGELDNVEFLCMNSLFLPKSIKQYDLVFIDPPYHLNLAAQALNSLLAKNWLKNQALIVIELAKTDDLPLLDTENFCPLVKRIYGNNKLLIIQHNKK